MLLGYLTVIISYTKRKYVHKKYDKIKLKQYEKNGSIPLNHEMNNLF